MREFTQSEAQQIYEAEKGLRESGLDVDHGHAEHNASLILQHFQQNPALSVTVQSIYAFVEKNKNQFIWRTPAQREFDRAARQNPDLANQLATYLATQGRPGQLANDGDQFFENLTLLFTEINSRRESASPQTIAAAEDRISHRPGKQLVRVAQPRKTEPTSRAAKDSPGTDSTNWLGTMVKTSDGSYRSKNVHEQRRALEAVEAAKSQTQTSALDESEATWRRMATELLADGTHSQQARVRAIYDAEQGQGSSWRRIYEACKKEAGLYRNARSIR